MFRLLKTKVGFTLVELLVVVLIIGIVVAIGIPTYQGITKNNRIRLCGVQRREVLAEVRDWCNNNDFNENYTFTITSDGTKGTVVAEPDSNIELITKDVLDGDVPFCPAGGTFTIVMTKRPASIVHLAISCNGGEDGDSHK